MDDVRLARQPPGRQLESQRRTVDRALRPRRERDLDVVAARHEVQRVGVGAQLELHVEPHAEPLDELAGVLDALH